MQKITTMLWFDGQAEEAVKLYTSLFKNSKTTTVFRPDPSQPPLTIAFELDGRKFEALNGGPQFKFTEAMSLVIHCEDQKEVDHFWSKLTADGGAESMCGWLKDKFGVSWQVVPNRLIELLTDKDKGRADRAMQAMLKMKKIVIADLEKAADSAN
ncbi:MAG TPA: VOC family protein [Rhizobiaceae bacterium]|nr:VOC family protein [Rhizobiaceae bacterium]